MINWKKIISAAISMFFIFSMVSCTNDKDEEGMVTFSVWLGRGVDVAYYADYADNPVLPVYTEKTYVGEDGEDVKINLEFQIPPSGSEADNFNILIATGDYTDIMNTTYYTGSVIDLYEDGVALDITDYVEKYMPNYMGFLEKNPELAITSTNLVDGEPRFLQINQYHTNISEGLGLIYRRDWIVEYGSHPETGAPFSGEYTIEKEDGTWNTDSWVDDVVFPSGGSDPVYISDWEWMFEIFETAMEDLGITDGYALSIYYSGYCVMGAFVSSIGGGGHTWYRDKSGEIAFGGNSDNMRVYLEMMSNWYEKGWIDRAFAERTNVMPWRVNEARVRQGKVGAWYGMDNQLLGRLDMGDELTRDIVTFAASYPINDIYGEEKHKFNEPYFIYQTEASSGNFIITDKAKRKDMVALFRFIDEFYNEENSLYQEYGYSREEVAENQNEFYLAHGLEDGAYYDAGKVADDGRRIHYRNDILFHDFSLRDPICLRRLWGLSGWTPTRVVFDRLETEQFRHMKSLWGDVYINTGMLSQLFYGQLDSDQSREFYTIQRNINDFMERNIPRFIRGERDPTNDDEWNAFAEAMDKFQPGRATEILQDVMDALEGE